MSGKTTIEWTAMPGFAPAVWNPTTGCTRVSAGCDNCYAFALHDQRYAANLRTVARVVPNHAASNRQALQTGWWRSLHPELVGAKAGLSRSPQYDRPFSRVQLLEDRVDAPLRTKKPTCYFVDSMADLFHEDVPDEFIARVWDAMRMTTDRHRYLVLTKRPERMASWVANEYDRYVSAQSAREAHVLHNVWLGTSVEDQRAADERIPHLLATPAAVRFLSCEPLLGPVDLSRWLWEQNPVNRVNIWGEVVDVPLRELQWVIVGGESGPRARPMDIAWARSLRDQCAAAGVSYFMKQMGSLPGYTRDDEIPWSPLNLRESHGRDMSEWPDDLRVRTWPQ